MLGMKAPKRRSSREEGEKPFWISFSDLMTALMVLFLVAMAVALMAVTQGLQQQNQAKKDYDLMIMDCVGNVEALTKLDEFRGVKVHGHSIDFGTLVQFEDKEHSFDNKDKFRTKAEQEQFIRKFVGRVLNVARAETCDKWLKKVVVEGFASNTGDYLYNLNLSYLRSQRVLCALLNTQAPDALSLADRKLIQTLFLAGGSSFNTTSGSPAQMRRVEIKLEFRDVMSQREAPPDIPLDPGLKCPNDK